MNIADEPMAKSKPPMTLKCHTEEVVAAVSGLIAALESPLAEVVDPSFYEMLRIAAFFHDLGKAANGFQTVVTYQGAKEKRPRWPHRHEALSTAILLASGLHTVCEPQMVGAVLSHHKTLDDAKLTQHTGRGDAHEDFEENGLPQWRQRLIELRQWWKWVREYILEAQQAKLIPALPHPLPDDPLALPDLYVANEALEDILKNVNGLTAQTLPWILARGLLMGAVHLASARMGVPLTLLSAQKIRPAEGFQERLQKIRGSVLLEAPTGSGKTEAALYWALANRSGGERIFYVLPYQASINKMGERLEKLFGKENVGIIHHRAALQEFARHFEIETDNYEAASDLAKVRVDQTRQFYRPIKIMTPYQLLKLMFGCRFFEIGLAELLGGLVIFDEIHAYDPHVAALIEIAVAQLTALKVRFLFMSATFPTFLKERLKSAIGECPVIVVERGHERDERLLETARHRLHIHPDSTLESLIPDIVADAADKKVLVVCNRVAQAQSLYEEVRKSVPSVALLHSRFISADRTKKENELVAFPDDPDDVRRQIPLADLVISTQVVEVSLNVSFDTIYTEIAPVDALLQRFGRVNRLNQHGEPVPVHVATLYNENRVKYIYSPERIALTLQYAPDGENLFPHVENNWVRNTYSCGYTEDEEKKYKLAYESFSQTVSRLRPFYTGSDDDFYDLFDNYNVVPVRFEAAYREAVENKRYYEAVQFIVSLSQVTYMQMKEWMTLDDVNHVYYASRRYDDELGLLNEPEVGRKHIQASFDKRCF